MNNKPELKLEKGTHRAMPVIFIRFAYNRKLIGMVKQRNAIYSDTNKCWYIPANRFNYTEFKKGLEEVVTIIAQKTKPEPNHLTHGKKEVTLEVNGKEGIVYIRFDYDQEIIDEIRRLHRSWYHVGAKIWSVPNTDEHTEQIQVIFQSHHYNITLKEITHSYTRKKEFKKKPKQWLIPNYYHKQLKLENKSKRTIEIYESFINQFLNEFSKLDPKDISVEQIRGYILHQREHLGYSESYQNQLISSLKSFYRIMYKRALNYEEIPRPKKTRSLPRVLAKQEVEKILNIPTNLKHRLILALLYGCGLRLNEVICLEVRDFNFKNNTLMIIRGKGSKDRQVPIPKPLVPLLHQYAKSYLPDKYLFYGQNQVQYSGSSIQKMVRDYAIKAGIEKRVTPHTLRHCYATHMLEKGVDLRYIQELLGHRSSKTTEIYTHVTSRKLGELGNPLDDITF